MSTRVGDIGGWAFPGGAKKAHYFEAGHTISICGKWMFIGRLTENQGASSPDDCVICSRKLAALGVRS
jgi:hypothetical protein